MNNSGVLSLFPVAVFHRRVVHWRINKTFGGILTFYSFFVVTRKRKTKTGKGKKSEFLCKIESRKNVERERKGKTDVALTPSLYEDVATFFYTFRHCATVDRNDVDEIARRIIRACTVAV